MTPAGTTIDVQNEWEENTTQRTVVLYLATEETAVTQLLIVDSHIQPGVLSLQLEKTCHG